MDKSNIKIKLRTIVLDCGDAKELSDFYSKLLGWEKTVVEEDWVLMRDPSGGTGLSFQSEPLYVKPVWPEDKKSQQKMLHMDFLVDDLDKACEYAIKCGAVLAPEQFLSEVRVFFDPAGHPFCLFEDVNYIWNNS
ncbi:glyoxalase-like domain protein [Oxobacter pfennigii]|uniref:Glyoxalase-like domain protein n=1 Tax=Oxobacter pfennigii TaxID=36849 RepID=A0A0P8X5R6_9CLOT|nr:VOC family protein [Oxobacter pfennigii]KPU46212.1 glyoxalase-like domain protein [Oxobacter pfennigii]